MKILVLILFLLAACAPIKSSLRQTTIDVGADVAEGFYPSAGVSVPVGPVWLSAGFWVGWDYKYFERAWGPYITIGWSWSPFDG